MLPNPAVVELEVGVAELRIRVNDRKFLRVVVSHKKIKFKIQNRKTCFYICWI